MSETTALFFTGFIYYVWTDNARLKLGLLPTVCMSLIEVVIFFLLFIGLKRL